MTVLHFRSPDAGGNVRTPPATFSLSDFAENTSATPSAAPLRCGGGSIRAVFSVKSESLTIVRRGPAAPARCTPHREEHPSGRDAQLRGAIIPEGASVEPMKLLADKKAVTFREAIRFPAFLSA